ncbi:hypothetical protein DFH94DRAFT_632760 [Russula ochroleuca]|uniref:Uncharacterized protein n=1 Tax=Russula ochroleuca TaxID=152965 RepID=A0A9P5T8I4_9AGAM|nr:hypothetical protein DFH94DRAFT_632760 [Russula ochroleuca]
MILPHGVAIHLSNHCLQEDRVWHPRAGKIKLVVPAVTYNGKKMSVNRPPPWLSQHTDEVRRRSMICSYR